MEAPSGSDRAGGPAREMAAKGTNREGPDATPAGPSRAVGQRRFTGGGAGSLGSGGKNLLVLPGWIGIGRAPLERPVGNVMFFMGWGFR